MTKKLYTIDDVTVEAKSRRTANRRVRGFKRGELDINGKTILAIKRTPPGQPLRKKAKK